MLRGKRCRCDGNRSAIERLGLARVPCFFGNDGKVVQRVGQVRMKRTQLFFLNGCGAPQQFKCGLEVAGRRGLFRSIEEVLSAWWRHFVVFSAAPVEGSAILATGLADL